MKVSTKQTAKSQPLFRTLSRPGEWVRESPDVWRYLVRGNHPLIVLVLGWDRPLATFFAQVWLVPATATDYEDGELVHWVGTYDSEIPDENRLASAVSQFVVMPEALRQEVRAGPRLAPPRQ